VLVLVANDWGSSVLIARDNNGDGRVKQRQPGQSPGRQAHEIESMTQIGLTFSSIELMAEILWRSEWRRGLPAGAGDLRGCCRITGEPGVHMRIGMVFAQ
jgi:hypothetical protein